MNAYIELLEIARIADQLSVLCDDDDRLFQDMLEGETSLHSIIFKLHNQIALDQELVTGISERQTSLAERKRRLTDRIAASKAAIGQFLRAAHLPKIELDEATYSVRAGKPGLRIVDPEAVPLDLCRTKTEPDKALINAEYETADSLPNWLIRDVPKDVVTARTR